MAVRASNVLPEAAYRDYRIQALRVKTLAQQWITKFNATGSDANELRDVRNSVRRKQTLMAAWRQVPGIAQYAKDQEDDQTYDVAAETAQLQTDMGQVISWIDTQAAGVATPFVWDDTTDPEVAVWAPATFTPAQLSQLVTRLQTVVDQVT